MMKQAVRLTVLTIALAAVGAAAWIVWRTDRLITSNDAAVRYLDTTGARASTTTADLRAAQQSYVAADQGDAFWSGRVSALSAELDDSIAALKSSSTMPDTAAALDEASRDLQNFDQVDRRARELTRTKQLTPASDLIYSDGFDQTKKASDAIIRAISGERAWRDASTLALRRRMAAAAAGAVGLLALVAILLTPVSKQSSTTATLAERATERAVEPLKSDPLDLPIAAPALPAPPVIDFGALAALCVDFARVSDPSGVPALLSRTSDILDAAGLVVWVADPDGRELFPTLVHGYSPHIATRLGTLSRDAENVTAAAFRTALVQVVKATPASNGAVAAPLGGPTGTVGVLAAELRNAGEQQDVRRAAVAIVAAQVATLVGPPSARAARTEATG